MEVKGDYNFTLEIPDKVIYGMKPIDLPPNMRIRYEDYLDKQEDKESKTFQILKEREKYAANVIAFGEIVTRMVANDLSFDEAYAGIANSIDDMMQQVDAIFGELMMDEEANKLFQRLFQRVFKLKQKIDENTEIDTSDKILVGIKDVQGKLVYSLDGYGVSGLAKEILEDENIANAIDRKYVKPIQGLLKEYIALFMEVDEEECYETFSDLFVQTPEFLAYQSIMNILVVLAIEENTNISDILNNIEKDRLMEPIKEMILNIQGFDEYKEEIKGFMKVLLDEQTQ